jgi:tRNA1Val (adenine37-N6)-methyltransferase
VRQVIDHDHDYFTWQDIIILQQSDVFKIGTDSLLLGTWVPRVVKDANLILDAGTGCGILALMMARHFSGAQVHAIDVDENAVLLTERNINQSSWKERMVIRKENVLEPVLHEQFKFDLIISNPPFYTSQNPPKEGYKARSKHSDGPVGHWMTGLLDRIHPAGEMCLIVPATAAMDWIRDANQMGYYVRNRMDVFSHASDVSPVRSLLHFSTRLCKPVLTLLNIYQENRSYTPEYLRMTGLSVTQNSNP